MRTFVIACERLLYFGCVCVRVCVFATKDRQRGRASAREHCALLCGDERRARACVRAHVSMVDKHKLGLCLNYRRRESFALGKIDTAETVGRCTPWWRPSRPSWRVALRNILIIRALRADHDAAADDDGTIIFNKRAQ